MPEVLGSMLEVLGSKPEVLGSMPEVPGSIPKDACTQTSNLLQLSPVHAEYYIILSYHTSF